jgi:thiamine biosynthesis lipoprotein
LKRQWQIKEGSVIVRKNGVDRRHFLVLITVFLVLGVATLGGYYFFYLPYLESSDSRTQSTKILMDTIVDVRVDGRNSAQLVDQVFATMESLEQTLSRFVATSEVALINQQAGEWVKVSSTTLELVQLGVEIGDISQGAFDITIGALLDLWGFGSGLYYVPTEEELAQALATVDYRRVEVNPTTSEVRIPQGVILDLGGIAKGFVVDGGISLLRKAKVQRSIINAGGDISVIGKRPDGQPWRVGVQNPDSPSDIRWILPLDNNSVVTSGDYQRFFSKDGQRYHHILDPKTGYPARGLRSVTIIGENGAISDALSTAVFVLGWDEGRALVESLDNVEAIIVSDTDVWMSPGLAKQVVTQ